MTPLAELERKNKVSVLRMADAAQDLKPGRDLQLVNGMPSQRLTSLLLDSLAARRLAQAGGEPLNMMCTRNAKSVDVRQMCCWHASPLAALPSTSPTGDLVFRASSSGFGF